MPTEREREAGAGGKKEMKNTEKMLDKFVWRKKISIHCLDISSRFGFEFKRDSFK